MAAPTPKEIRERFSDYSNDWLDIREEARIDMRYVAGDPWDPKDRQEREDAGRPCISLDEIGQYLNQYVNNLRQNPRGIQVSPVGDGANDKLATHRENIVRGIEYRSNAQAAYITAAEGGVERSYGFARLKTIYSDDSSFNQEIRIARIPNPDTVTLDPDYKEADASDIEHAFVTDLVRKADFRRKYKGAKFVSFSAENQRDAPQWIRENYVQIAEFWQVNKKERELVLVDLPGGPQAVFEDELRVLLEQMGEVSRRGKDGKFAKPRDLFKILKSRQVEIREVVQYLTNGIEIIDEVEWAGSRIPILSCFGKELFLDDGSGGSKRHLLSMVRLARDPQMLHAYFATQQAEEAGMAPKSPVMGYKGQFESDWEAWEMLNKQPRSVIQVDPIVDAATGQVLPLPTRPQFEPNIEKYEIGKESARRSIQAAMGIAPLPTDTLKQNQKSGVALEKIQSQEAIGSFHFTDNFDRFLQNAGWQINELIPKIYDTAREIPVREADGKASLLRLNDRAYEVQNPDKQHLHTDQGDYDVTVSTGPNYLSQREQASAFVDLLITNLQQLPIPPDTAVKILALGIKMKSMGAIGDQIAELLSPSDENNLPPQVQAAMQQLQGQIQVLTQENAALHMERAGKQLEWQSRMQIEREKGANALTEKHLEYITRVVVAEIAKQSKADEGQARADAAKELAVLGLHKDVALAAHDAAHAVASDTVAHQRAKDLATHQVAIQPPPVTGEPPAET